MDTMRLTSIDGEPATLPPIRACRLAPQRGVWRRPPSTKFFLPDGNGRRDGRSRLRVLDYRGPSLQPGAVRCRNDTDRRNDTGRVCGYSRARRTLDALP